MKRFARLGHLTVLALILSTVLSACVQNVFYQPDRVLYDTPQRVGLRFQETMLPSHDGTMLGGWFVPAVGVPEGKQAKGTVIHFHGNGQNMSSHWRSLEWLPRKGYNLFVFDYRGYGISEGTPNVEDVHLDCLAALDHIRNRPDSTPDKLIIYGQSLGGTHALAAVAAAPREGIKAMIIESTFSSFSRIAHDKLPGSGWLMNDRYSAEQWVSAMAPIPLLLIHGDRDKIIHHRHSQHLMDLAKPRKQLIIEPGAGHLTLFQGESAARIQNQIISFIEGNHDKPQ